jgi:hypothetical protein
MALVTLVFHGRMLTSSATDLIATRDITSYFLWLHRYTYEEFMAGRLPLWNPYTYCGTPFAANPQATVFYPLSWLFMVASVTEAQKLTIALHSLQAQVFMYMFLRRALQPGAASVDDASNRFINQFTALLGALIFAFGNHVMANVAVGHLTMVFTITWLPLALYFCERAIGSGRWVWLMWAGMTLGVQALAGEPQNCYYSAVIVSVYGLVRTLVQPRRPEHSRAITIIRRTIFWALCVAVIGVTAAGAAMIQLLPTAEFAQLSDRSANNFTFAAFMSLPPSSLLEFIIPWNTPRFWGWGRESWGFDVQVNWEFGGYVGIFTLILAAWSCAVRNSAAAWAMRIIFALAIVLAIGKHTPIYKLLYHTMPGLALFRIPGRAMMMAHVSMSVLAAFGARHLLMAGAMRWQQRRWRVITIALLCAAMAIWAALTLVVGMQSVRVPDGNIKLFGDVFAWNDRMVLGPLLSLAGAAVVALAMGWIRPRTVVAAMIGLAIAVDLFFNNPPMKLGPQSANDVSYDMLRSMVSAADERDKPFRIDSPATQLNANAAIGARAEVVNGYQPMSIGRFYRFAHWMRSAKTSSMMRHELPEIIYHSNDPFPLRILNVRYSAKWDEASQAYRPADTVPLPRAWVVDRAEVITDEQQTLERLRNRSFDPATAVILEQPPRIELTAGAGPVGRATTTRHSPGLLEIKTASARAGYLVLSEVFYPGWKATVDGAPVAIERADYLLTALPLPAGDHTIIYRFNPSSFKIGALVTAVTWLGAIGATIFSWRRQRARHTTHGELPRQSP